MLFAFIARFSISIFVLQSIGAAGTIANPLGQLFASPQDSIVCYQDAGSVVLKNFKPDIETFKDWDAFTSHVLSDDYLAVSQVNRRCNTELGYSFNKCWHYLCDRLYPEVRLAYFPRERLSESERSYCDALHAAVTERSEEKVALFKKAVVEHNRWKSTVFLFDLEGKQSILYFYETPSYPRMRNYSDELELKKELLLVNRNDEFLSKQIIDRFLIYDITNILDTSSTIEEFESAIIENFLPKIKTLCEAVNLPYYDYYKTQLEHLLLFKHCLIDGLSKNNTAQFLENITWSLNTCESSLQKEINWFNNAFAFVVIGSIFKKTNHVSNVYSHVLKNKYNKIVIPFTDHASLYYGNQSRNKVNLSSYICDELCKNLSKAEPLEVVIKKLVGNNPTRLIWNILYVMSDKTRCMSKDYCDSNILQLHRMHYLQNMLNLVFDMYRDQLVKSFSLRTLKFYEPSESVLIIKKHGKIYQKARFLQKLVSYIREHRGEINGLVLIQMLDAYRNDLHKSRRRWINVAATALFAYGIGNDLYQAYKKT